MFEIVSLLRESKLFSDIEVLELIDEELVKVIKIKAKVSDDTILFIHEIFRINSHKYSYHWQEKNEKIIIRWDNSPHWKNLNTFPYHKHIEDNVLPCPKMTVSDVIDEIEKRLKK